MNLSPAEWDLVHNGLIDRARQLHVAAQRRGLAGPGHASQRASMRAEAKACADLAQRIRRSS